MRQRYQVRLRVLGANKHKARRSGAGDLHGPIDFRRGLPYPRHLDRGPAQFEFTKIVWERSTFVSAVPSTLTRAWC